MGGNTSTSFDHGKATQDADEILNIAKQVSQLFDETEAEIPKLQQYWQSTTSKSSADNAVELFNSYKANYEGFLSKIQEKATDIKRASSTYTQVESAANETIIGGHRISKN